MRPETLLKENLEGVPILLTQEIDHLLILFFIHGARRVEHFSTSFQCHKSRKNQFLLKCLNRVNTLFVPVFCRFRPLIESSLATARRIQQNAIEHLWFMGKILPEIECDTDIRTSHTFKILKKLRNSIPIRLIRDDETVRKILCKLRGFSSRTRCHIENRESVIDDFPICKMRD